MQFPARRPECYRIRVWAEKRASRHVARSDQEDVNTWQCAGVWMGDGRRAEEQPIKRTRHAAETASPDPVCTAGWKLHGFKFAAGERQEYGTREESRVRGAD